MARETFGEWLGRVSQQRIPPYLRRGQHLYNELYLAKPRLGDVVCGTEADPFYSDANLPRFYEYLAAHWEEEQGKEA